MNINDENWPYDEDGYPKGLPMEHPSRKTTEALLVLTGKRDEIEERKWHNKTDYTEEFKPFIGMLELPKGEYSISKFEDHHNGMIRMECDTKYNGQWYRAIYKIDYFAIRNCHEFASIQNEVLFSLAKQMKLYIDNS